MTILSPATIQPELVGEGPRVEFPAMVDIPTLVRCFLCDGDNNLLGEAAIKAGDIPVSLTLTETR